MNSRFTILKYQKGTSNFVKYFSAYTQFLCSICPIFFQNLLNICSISLSFVRLSMIQVKLDTELDVKVEVEGAGATKRDNTTSLTHFWLFWKIWNFLSHVFLVQALLSNSKQDIQSLAESPLGVPFQANLEVPSPPSHHHVWAGCKPFLAISNSLEISSPEPLSQNSNTVLILKRMMQWVTKMSTDNVSCTYSMAQYT